jgi:hypothetical protein
MAKKEEIQKRNIDEANNALGEQLNLVSSLQDSMSQLIKIYKEKGTLDKLSLDNIKAVTAATKAMKAEYDSVKDIQKDIAKNTKLQSEIETQKSALLKRGGDALKDELKMLKIKEESLSKANAKLVKFESDKRLGKKIDDAIYQQAVATLSKKQEQYNLAKEILTPEAEQVVLLEEASSLNEKNAQYLNEQLNQQENLVKSQSLFTSALGGANKFLEKMGLGDFGKKLGLEAAAQKAKDLTYELTDGGKKTLGIFGKLRVATASFGTALKSALGPIALIGLITDAYNKGSESAQRLNEENVELSRNLGISQKTANTLMVDIRGIGSSMGITGAMAAQSAGNIYTALDGAEKISKKTLETFMKLNVFAGMSAESIADIQKLSKLTGTDAGKVADEMATVAQESIKANKVNISMRQVMDGVGKVSNIMKLNLKGSAVGLTEAFIQSKKLGLELSKVEDIANSLLNIEDSIAAEMEAELLTGKDLNLEKAREAALNNDNKTLMTEIANQFGSIEDYQKMNRVQQEAFAKSIGMSRDGLADMLVSSKENAAANTDMVSEQDKSLAAMQSMAKTSETLAAREEARANQFAKIFELLNPIVELFKEIGPLVLQLVTPIVETLAPILKDLMTNALPFIKDIFKSIGAVIGELMVALKPVFLLLVDIGKTIMPIIADLFKRLAPIAIDLIKAVKPLIFLLADAAKNLLPIIADLFKQLIPIVTDIIKQLMPIISEILNAVMPLLKPILDIFVELAKILIPIVVNLLKSIMPIIQPILTIFTGIANIISGILGGDFSKVAKGLKSIAEGLINLVIGAFSFLLNMPVRAINAMLDFVPGFGGNTIPLVEFPKVKLAEGGIVTKPTNALIGEAGPEAVVPLNSDKSMNINTRALEAKIDKLISIIEKGGDVYLDGSKVGKALTLSGYRM